MGKCRFWLKNIGKGVKKILVAKEKRTIAKANILKLSCLREPFQLAPLKTLEADFTLWYVKSTLRSILTRRRSKSVNGSAINRRDSMKATMLKPLHKYRVQVAKTAGLRFAVKENRPTDKQKPKAKPRIKPSSVKPL